MREYPFLKEAISNQLESYRKSRKLTKSDLAEFSELDRHYISDIRLGRKNVSVNAIFFLCETLGVPPSDFFKLVEKDIRNLKETKENVEK